MFLQLGQKHCGEASGTNRQVLEKVWQFFILLPPQPPFQKKTKPPNSKREQEGCGQVFVYVEGNLAGTDVCQHCNPHPGGCVSQHKASFRALFFVFENAALAVKSSRLMCSAVYQRKCFSSRSSPGRTPAQLSSTWLTLSPCSLPLATPQSPVTASAGGTLQY